MADKYDVLRLENQVCFPLYACAKEVVRQYKPYLDKLDLTYTQYIAMMVLWEEESISVKELGNKLFLDSGTLTPVLKTLEKKEYISRARSEEDERVLIASITEKGIALREEALQVPQQMRACIDIPDEDLFALYTILNKMLKK